MFSQQKAARHHNSQLHTQTMTSIKTAFDFLIAQQFNKHENLLEETRRFEGIAQSYDYYEPNNRRALKGTIIFIHGMALAGNRDPRQINVCRSLAAAGYRVLAPDIEDIRKINIRSENIYQVSDVIRVAASDRSITENGKVALFAPSFSAGMSLVAASLPEINNLVSSMCLIGAFADMAETILHIIDNENADPYAQHIMLYNFIEGVLGKNPEIKQALWLSIEDNWYQREQSQLDKYIKTLSEKKQQHIQKILHDKEYQLEIAYKVMKDQMRLTEELRTINRVNGLKAATLLVHGKDDNVIPATQSDKLFQKMIEFGKTARVLKTPVISHGDTSIGLSMFPEISKLVAAFGWYFKHI